MLFAPDSILRWHRQLVGKKWAYAERQKPGRPRIPQVIVELILRFAKENPSCGYERTQGALANVGYNVTDTTVDNVLRQHGTEPAHEVMDGKVVNEESFRVIKLESQSTPNSHLPSVASS